MANGIQILPSLDRFAGLRQGASNLVGGLIQGQQQQAGLSDQQQIMQFIQARQQGQQPGLPQFQTPQGAAAFNSFLGQQNQQPGFTLSQGQTRFGPGGQQIAAVAPEAAPAKPRAGSLQVAEQGDESGLPVGTVFQFDPQGNAKIISEAGSGTLTGKQKVDLAVSQSDKFLKDKRIADFQEIERGARGIVTAFKRSKASGKKGPSDQALGVLFQKMLDPGSVVRESEFARTSQGQGAIDKMTGAIQKISTGGIGLTDGEREELMNVANLLLNESKITFNKTFREFSTRADEIGLNKKIVFGGVKPFEIQEEVRQGVGIPPLSEVRGGSEPQLNDILAELKRRGQ